MKIALLTALLLLLVRLSAGGQEVFHATSGSSVTLTNGAILSSTGTLNFEAGSFLNNAGSITIIKTGSGNADFTDHTLSAYPYGTGKFIFTGTGIQNIGSINPFERIEVSNAGLLFNSDIKANTWYLTSGVINTNNFIAIAASSTAGAIQADALNPNFSNGWFNGKLRRFVSPATVNNYPFPVGDINRPCMAELDNLLANPLIGISYITVNFGPKPGTDANIQVSEGGTPFTSVNSAGVWYLIPDALPVGGRYDLKLFFNGFTGLTDNAFAPLRRPDNSSNAADWTVPIGSSLPPGNSPGRTVAPLYARRNAISGFSQWGIGMSLVPLPLDLLSFIAIKESQAVSLQWITANEVNTDHFELYRGGHAAALQYLGSIAAMPGAAGDQHYQYMDAHPLTGDNYYQLKIVDKDQRSTWSRMVTVRFNDNPNWLLYPNPVLNGQFTIRTDTRHIKALYLVTADGRKLNCQYQISVASGTILVLLPNTLAKGVYRIQLEEASGTSFHSFVVQ